MSSVGGESCGLSRSGKILTVKSESIKAKQIILLSVSWLWLLLSLGLLLLWPGIRSR